MRIAPSWAPPSRRRRRSRLESAPELRAETFCERRELGVLNIGGPGTVTVDGVEHPLAGRDGLYVGRGSKVITFASDSAQATPAKYYLLSFPAHAAHPTVRIRQSEAEAVRLGSSEASNQRTLYKLIHPGGVRSCQLVMGFTVLEPGSRVEHHAAPHPRAPHGGLPLLRRARQTLACSTSWAAPRRPGTWWSRTARP